MLVETGLLLGLANDIKIIGGVISASGLLFGVFRVINWIKNKFINIDKNVTDLKDSMDKNMVGLRDDIKAQTASITDALKEQRADFRTFVAPVLLQTQFTNSSLITTPVRAKRTRKIVK